MSVHLVILDLLVVYISVLSFSLVSSFLGQVEGMLTQIVTEDGKAVWKCEVCGKDFPFKSGGKRHVETMHFETPGFECEVCGKVLKNKNSYQNHISIIHGIKRRSGVNAVN